VGALTKGRPDMTHGSAMTLDIACERIEQLAFQIMQAIQPELARHPTHPNNLYIALNALAFATAILIVGADGRGRQFFDHAVTENITALRRGYRGLNIPKNNFK
jgi:hypothetical protein